MRIIQLVYSFIIVYFISCNSIPSNHHKEHSNHDIQLANYLNYGLNISELNDLTIIIPTNACESCLNETVSYIKKNQVTNRIIAVGDAFNADLSAIAVNHQSFIHDSILTMLEYDVNIHMPTIVKKVGVSFQRYPFNQQIWDSLLVH
jgi:hypothetical protein